MNLLDQIELYVLEMRRERTAQKDYWLFIYNSMKSGLLMTKAMEKHLQYKLNGLGIQTLEDRSSSSPQ
jgi:hypothetical protein